MAVTFLPSGDTGLTVQFGFDIDRALSRRIMALRAAVDEVGIDGVVETVPTYRSLLVHYDPLRLSQADLIAALEPLVAQLDADQEHVGRKWWLPVCFDEVFSPDLANVADFAKMEPQAVVETMCSVEHLVYMLGFAPGMPYMGDLPEAMAIPRRKVPVKGVEKGSVLVATGLTVIYPAVNPTGWHVVGRCPVPMFDLAEADPVLLAPGDIVRFRAVEQREYDDIEMQVADGAYVLEEGEPA